MFDSRDEITCKVLPNDQWQAVLDVPGNKICLIPVPIRYQQSIGYGAAKLQRLLAILRILTVPVLQFVVPHWHGLEEVSCKLGLK